MLNDVDLISAISENILGPVIKESIMRKERNKVTKNELANVVQNTNLNNMNTMRKKPTRAKPPYPILKHHTMNRSKYSVEKLQNGN